MTHSVLLVGLGQVAMGYDLDSVADDLVLTHARAFTKHPAFHVVGGVDPQPERRKLFTRAYGAPAMPDLTVALREWRPDVVVIATPTGSHASVLRTTLEEVKLKAVLGEKPLAYSLDEARAMVRLAEDVGCAFCINYLRRASPGAREIKRRLRDGRIAGPIKGVAWYSKGLLHNGSHIVNLVEYWCGPITGFRVIDPGRELGAYDCEPDVRIDFAGGSLTLLAAREEDYSLHEIDLVAANGRLRYAQGGAEIVWQATVPDALVPSYTVLTAEGEIIPSETHLAQWHVADQLAAKLEGADADLCSGADALKTLEWLLKIKEAS